MIDNQFIKKPSGFNKQRLDSFVRSVKTNKQDVQKKELDEALDLHTQLVAQDMMQRAMELPPFEDLRNAYIEQGLSQIPKAAYGMEIGAVMPSINTPFTYPSQQNLTPPNSDMFKKNADKYEGKGLGAFKNLVNTAANAVLNPAIQEYNQNVYNAKQKAAKDAEDAEETDVPGAKMGGDLVKAQSVGDISNALRDAYNQAMANLQSDEPVYNDAGDLIDKDQLQQAATDAYNKYYQNVAQAYKDNPTLAYQPFDASYLNQYPELPGLESVGYNLSGEGIAPELYKGKAAAQAYSELGPDYPGLGRYLGLSPQRRMVSEDMNYSPNYKAMYNDAVKKGQYDRFETNIEANPTVAGSILDKLGVGKMFATRNYNINQNILPEGQSVLDPERLAETQRRQTLLANEDMPGGGLFQTDEMDPYIWENRTRRDRRDVLQGAGIDPSRKNLRRLGEDYFDNLAQDRQREEYESSREGYENKLAAEEAAIKSGAARGSIGTRPRNPYDLMGTGEQMTEPVIPPTIQDSGSNNQGNDILKGIKPGKTLNPNVIDILGPDASIYGTLGKLDSAFDFTPINRIPLLGTAKTDEDRARIIANHWYNDLTNYQGNGIGTLRNDMPQPNDPTYQKLLERAKQDITGKLSKQEGGTMLPMFQVDGEYPGIDWNITNPFGQKQGPLFGNNQNKITLGLPPLFPDADKMQTFFDNGNAPLTGEAFGEQLDQYVPKYTGQEPQQLATATGTAKLKSNIAPTTYLTMANATGKYLADNIFGKGERERAEEQYRKSRFLENNLALTSPDTQFDPRLRGFDRTTDAFGGAPYAGAQVQYGQPLIPMGQRGTEIPITMQEGGVYTLTPEMIKQIIENGGEVEYVDNSNNFVNPFNQ